jgi:hypothetical protein
MTSCAEAQSVKPTRFNTWVIPATILSDQNMMNNESRYLCARLVSSLLRQHEIWDVNDHICDIITSHTQWRKFPIRMRVCHGKVHDALDYDPPRWKNSKRHWHEPFYNIFVDGRIYYKPTQALLGKRNIKSLAHMLNSKTRLPEDKHGKASLESLSSTRVLIRDAIGTVWLYVDLIPYSKPHKQRTIILQLPHIQKDTIVNCPIWDRYDVSHI